MTIKMAGMPLKKIQKMHPLNGTCEVHVKSFFGEHACMVTTPSWRPKQNRGG
jgi:hypothetical protein